jgi:putative phosphoesterase
MRIGLLADIHGNDLAFHRVLDALGAVDALLFAGDLCGYYPFVNECLAAWPTTPAFAVQGNHDAVLVDCLASGQSAPPEYRSRYGSALDRTLQSISMGAKTLVRSWPTVRTCDFGETRVMLVHGAPWDPLHGRVYPDFSDWDRFSNTPGDVVIMGHTHYPFVRTHKEKLIINPGSVGQARQRSRVACYGVLHIESHRVELFEVPYSPEPLIADAMKHDPDCTYLTKVLTR